MQVQVQLFLLVLGIFALTRRASCFGLPWFQLQLPSSDYAALRSASSAPTIPENLEAGVKSLTARWIADTLTGQHQPLKQSDNSRNPMLPVPENDSMPLLPETVNLDEFQNENFQGIVEFGGGELNGLTTILDNLDINLITMKIKYDITAGELAMLGQYLADVIVVTSPHSALTLLGEGTVSAKLTGPFISWEIGFTVNPDTNLVNVVDVTIDMEFQSIWVEFENFTICDELVDWGAFNENLKPGFDELWAQIRANLSEISKEPMNNFIERCNVKIEDLLYLNVTCPEDTTTSSTTELSTSSTPTEDLFVEMIKSIIEALVVHWAPQMTCGLGTTPTTDDPNTGSSWVRDWRPFGQNPAVLVSIWGFIMAYMSDQHL